MKKICTILLAISCQLLVCSFSVRAQYTDMYNFNDFNGIFPTGDLTLSGNVLYGMTSYGGANNYGCVFYIYTNGTLFSDIHDFDKTSGAIPYGSLTLSGSLLFGMTSTGGANDSGCIFSMHTDGSSYKVLNSFTKHYGVFPHGSLTLSGYKLYGMTKQGGMHDSGCIFSIDSNGAAYTDLHDFPDSNAYPYGSLILVNGKLYGMTSQGDAYDSGVIFSMDTNGSNYTVLHDFKGADGAYPWGSLKLLKDKFYGMTFLGGAHDSGCVFSIDTDGSGYMDLYDFELKNGAYPHGSLIYSGSDLLYGMTGRGGTSDSGCVFTVDTNGKHYRSVLDFNTANGSSPFGSLIIAGGNVLYGMTEYGGVNNIGVIFKVDTNNRQGLSVDEVTLTGNYVSVYPNPSSGKFTFQYSVISSQSAVKIYNMLGEEVKSFKLTGQSNQIDISNQSNGIYLYRITDSNGILVGEGKLVIQK